MKVESIAHLGVVAGVIKDLKIIEMIDKRIPKDEKENISTGEGVAGMIINGLGFSDRPISLTPQFFENKALELLFRPGVKAENFNRFKLGRCLDEIFDYGCSLLFSELSMEVCKQEKVDCTFNHGDTTSISVTGEYAADTDEQAIKITHGYSKDGHPELKQAVLEIMVTQDGNIPIMAQCWDGNESDNKIFEERSRQLVAEFAKSDGPRYLIADSKLYTKENSKNLRNLGFITRMPGNLSLEGALISQALQENNWTKLDDKNKFYAAKISHYDIQMRALVIFSDEAKKRSIHTVSKWQKKEEESLKKKLFHLQAQRFESYNEANKALHKLGKPLKYHEIVSSSFEVHKKFATKGRPKKDANHAHELFQINAVTQVKKKIIDDLIDHKACYVLITNIPAERVANQDVIFAYKQQNATVEKGFAFIKDPYFFVSSLYLKKPSRIQALLMIMTLSLLVYAVAQRRIRARLKELKTTLPNQINKPTATPTLRWLFQILHGINRVIVTINNITTVIIEGINDLKRQILSLLGGHVCVIYQIC